MYEGQPRTIEVNDGDTESTYGYASPAEWSAPWEELNNTEDNREVNRELGQKVQGAATQKEQESALDSLEEENKEISYIDVPQDKTADTVLRSEFKRVTGEDYSDELSGSENYTITVSGDSAHDDDGLSETMTRYAIEEREKPAETGDDSKPEVVATETEGTAEGSREEKVHSLFDSEYKGEKVFGPQGVVDYYGQLRGNFLDIRKSATNDTGEEEFRKKLEEATLIVKKIALVTEYLENDVWGEALQKEFGWGNGVDKEKIEKMLQQGYSAELIYSRILMGSRNPNWSEDDDEWSTYKYNLQDNAGWNLLFDNKISILENQGVEIDGYDLLDRIIDNGIIKVLDSKDLELLFKYGVDVNDVIERFKKDTYSDTTEVIRKYDVFKKHGANIDIQEMCDSLSFEEKAYCLDVLYAQGAKVDIMQLIDQVPPKTINKIAHEKEIIRAVMEYGGIKALDEVRDRVDPEYERSLLSSAARALENYGLTDEEIQEDSESYGDIIFLKHIAQYKIKIDEQGKYYQLKTTNNGKYYYDYDSKEVKRLSALEKDSSFFSNILKYNTGKPKWSDGSKYDYWRKKDRIYASPEEIFKTIYEHASKDTFDDPWFVELLARGCSYPANSELTYSERSILTVKMTSSNADKVIRRCKQNGVTIEDYVIESVYGPNGIPNDFGFRDW